MSEREIHSGQTEPKNKRFEENDLTYDAVIAHTSAGAPEVYEIYDGRTIDGIEVKSVDLHFATNDIHLVVQAPADRAPTDIVEALMAEASEWREVRDAAPIEWEPDYYIGTGFNLFGGGA